MIVNTFELDFRVTIIGEYMNPFVTKVNKIIQICVTDSVHKYSDIYAIQVRIKYETEQQR